MTIKLVGYDDDTDETCRVDLDIKELQEGQYHDAVKRLFTESFGEPIAGVQWECGVPNVDRAVIWRGRTFENYSVYLHVSFSDGRTW